MNHFKRNILLIEDDSGDADLIGQMVSEADGNYGLKTSARLSAGLRILSEEVFDVVFFGPRPA